MTLSSGGLYVALGSSFAAGPFLGSRVKGSPRAAGRSEANYAHIVAASAELELVDVTFSGATTTDLLEPSPRRPVAQIEAVSAETRLVTITCGGNDVGYLPTLTLSSFPRPLRSLQGLHSRLSALQDPATLDERFEQLEAGLMRVVEEVERRAPEAVIEIVDYLTVLPPDNRTSTGVLPSDVAAWGRGVASRLTSVFEAVSSDRHVGFVPAAARSIDHHAWSSVPWTNRFRLSLHSGAPYHPNPAGMREVAELILTGSC